MPQLGAAGGPYARTVRPALVRPLDLPSPEVIFDSVLARTTYKEHPTGISSMLFYLASIIIHGEYRIYFTCFQAASGSSSIGTSAVTGAGLDYVHDLKHPWRVTGFQFETDNYCRSIPYRQE